MTASSTVLEQLHTLVTEAFIEKVRGGVQEVVNKEGDVVEIAVKPTAAELAAAVTFLKNNNITSSPTDDSKLQELQKLTEARLAKRRERMSAQLGDALPDTGMH